MPPIVVSPASLSPPLSYIFRWKKMDSKRPILILYSNFIFSMLSLNVSKMFAISNPKSNFLFWESGGSRVIRLTIWAGGSYPRNGRPLIKKETFDLWNWWLDYITGKWLGEGMSSLQKIIFYLHLPLSCISSPKFISMFWGIFAVAWRQIQLCPSSLQVFWVEGGDRSSP